MKELLTHNHFISYVKWNIILDWKKNEVKEDRLAGKEHIKPYAYGTSAKGIPDKVKRGDILWLLTIPKFGKYFSYPSIIASFFIDEVLDQEVVTDKKKLDKIPAYIKNYRHPKTKKGWKYVILSIKEKSIYFPVNNAYDIVVNKVLKDKSIELKKKMAGNKYGYIAQYFQTIRKLKPNVGNEMMNFIKRISKTNTLFVSYRRRKGINTIKVVVEALLKKKINCWQDINRLPQNLPTKYKSKAETYFKLEINNAIKESRGFLAIKRKDYFNSPWTKLEFDSAKSKSSAKKYLFLEEDLVKLSNDKAVNILVKKITKSF